MPKIDGISYPDGIKAMLKDRKIGPLYRDFLDKRLCEEIYVFLEETASKRDPKSQYKIFFTSRGKYAINVEGPTLAKAKVLGEKQDWKSKEWKKIYDDAEEYIVKLAKGEHDSKFYETDPAFKEHHAFMLEKHILKMKYPTLLADLNTDDKKAVANVAALLKADKRAGEKAVKIFTKKTKGAPPPRETKSKIMKFFRIR
ncbi:hypothetical protein [Pseudooceanicola sp.]|uniref:hypothetical protein n=1 Tax=Pseudooceanicola sp. TaxID=1914328 RepID=UPI0035C66904